MSFKIASEIGLLGENHFANVPFKDPGDSLAPSREAEAGTKIEFIPIHYNKAPVISFIAYMPSIKDNFKQTVQSTQPFGRLDPIRMWKSSERQITLNFKIASSSEEMALRNLNNLSWLLASSYPTFDSSACGCSTAVAASPMFRVKYANLVTSTTNYSGLLSVIQGINVDHNFEKGVINVRPASNTNDKDLLSDAGFPRQAGHYVVASEITVGCTLDVVHEEALGWDFHTGEWRGSKSKGFPYGLGTVKVASKPPASEGGGATGQTAGMDNFFNNVSTAIDRQQAAEAKKALG
jgi:hypothetical protein